MFCITMFAVSFLYFITYLGLDPPVIGPDDKSANLAGSLLYFIFGCIYTLMPKFFDVSVPKVPGVWFGDRCSHLAEYFWMFPRI